MKKIHLYLFLIFLLAYIAITGGNFWESDGQTIYYTAKSIIDHGSFAIDCLLEAVPKNGVCYSKYGLFASISVIPMYLLDKLALDVFHSSYFFPGFFSSLTNIIISAALVVLIYQYLIKLKFSSRLSLIGATLFGVATYLPAYTKTLFSEPLITFLLYGAIYILLFSKLTVKNLSIAGTLLGLTFLTKFGVLIFMPVLIYLVYIRKINLRNVVVMSFPVAISVLVFFVYNYLRLGNIFDAGYRGIDTATPFWEGFFINTLSPGKSFFLYQPILVLAFLGFKNFLREQKLTFIIFALMTVISWLFYSVFTSPTGDLTWGTRYLYPTLPFFIISLMYFLKNNRKRLLWWLFGISIVVSILIQLSSVYLSHHRYRSYLNTKFGYENSNVIAYYNPQYSPLFGQWKMIFKIGYSPEDQMAWREAFQEYINFDTNYRLAPPDLFFGRSKVGLIYLLTISGIEIILIYKILRLEKI